MSCFQPASPVRIYDTTLRDGEQTPGVALTPAQKVEIARMVSSLGCHILDAGFPAAQEEDAEAVALILEAQAQGHIRADLEVLVMCRANLTDVEVTAGLLGGYGIGLHQVTLLLFTAASATHLRHKLGPWLMRRNGLPAAQLEAQPIGWLRQANERVVAAAIAHARRMGAQCIEFGAEDASRTDPPALLSLVAAAVAAGADRYIFADTAGGLTPEAAASYVQALRAAFPALPLVSHFHNDFGLATSNAVMACRHGMTTISTTLNGIGERAGNTPLHEVALALKVLYGVTIEGFAYDRLIAVSEAVAQLIGLPLSPMTPIIGRHAFTHESGIHVHGILQHPATYEALPPGLVGAERRIAFGKHSGRSGIRAVLHALADTLEARGITPSETLVEAILAHLHTRHHDPRFTTDRSAFVAAYQRYFEAWALTPEALVELAADLSAVPRMD